MFRAIPLAYKYIYKIRLLVLELDSCLVSLEPDNTTAATQTPAHVRRQPTSVRFLSTGNRQMSHGRKQKNPCCINAE